MDPHAHDSLLAEIDTLTEAELDALPFGMIQLDQEGRVLRFNATESTLAQVDREEQLGRSFFDEVAPCTKVQEFYGEFRRAFQERNLHVQFPYEFRFRDGRRKDVIVTMFYSRHTESVWVLVERPAPGR